MANLWVSVGLPASGKTTTLKKMMSEFTNAYYVSADDVRQEIYGDAAIQTNPAQIWSEVHRRVRNALESGRDVLLDGTMVKRVDRKALLAKCQNKASSVICMLFVTPPEVCVEWNRQRDRVVPEEVIYRMSNQLQKTPPEYWEGFDAIVITDLLQDG